jgi:TIR domain
MAVSGGVFLSYRRDDSRHAAGRLADDLAARFGAQRIFRDIEAIAPGVDFTVALERALSSCTCMLVLIGPRWLDIADAQGQRRLEHKGDWIRQEIEYALQRDIPVIPVLLEGTPPPDADALPASISALARRQGMELSDSRWHDDVPRLARALSQYVEPLPTPGPPPSPTPAQPEKKAWWKTKAGIGAIIGVAVVIAVVDGAMKQSGDDARTTPGPAPMPVPVPVSTTPNVTGAWSSATGNLYEFVQQGQQLQLRVSRLGRGVFAQGGGTIGPGGMEFSVMAQLNPNMLPALTNCRLAVAADGRSFAGQCSSAAGNFAESLYR